MGTQLELGPDAQYAVMMANDEAGMLRHEYVGIEHLLLGLLRQQDGSVVAALSRLGVTPSKLRDVIAATVKPGRDDAEGVGLRPFTSRCKTVLSEAGREASGLGHAKISAGDLLVGLLREKMGIGAQVLANAGVDVQSARSALHDVESAA